MSPTLKFYDPVTEAYIALGGGSSSSRTTVSFTTAVLVAGASATGTVTLGVGYRLYSITTSVPARFRLYTTTAKRDADASRPLGTDVDDETDHGLMFEFATTDTLLTSDLSPTVDGFDGGTPPDGQVPYAIMNTGASTAAITVTLLYLPTEA